jgi:hypothetical protein
MGLLSQKLPYIHLKTWLSEQSHANICLWCEITLRFHHGASGYVFLNSKWQWPSVLLYLFGEDMQPWMAHLGANPRAGFHHGASGYVFLNSKWQWPSVLLYLFGQDMRPWMGPPRNPRAGYFCLQVWCEQYVSKNTCDTSRHASLSRKLC